MSNTKDSKILEALLFASGSPISEDDLKEKIINKKEFKKVIEKLKEFYKDRGINLVKTTFFVVPGFDEIAFATFIIDVAIFINMTD